MFSGNAEYYMIKFKHLPKNQRPNLALYHENWFRCGKLIIIIIIIIFFFFFYTHELKLCAISSCILTLHWDTSMCMFAPHKNKDLFICKPLKKKKKKGKTKQIMMMMWFIYCIKQPLKKFLSPIPNLEVNYSKQIMYYNNINEYHYLILSKY